MAWGGKTNAGWYMAASPLVRLGHTQGTAKVRNYGSGMLRKSKPGKENPGIIYYLCTMPGKAEVPRDFGK